jgi:Phosphotransferase enzyme family
MSFDHQTNQDTYRLIVTRRNASEILLLSRGSASSLPCVEILRGERIAEQLTAELYAQHAFRGYCLFVLTHAAGLPHCAVMEVPDPREIASAGTCWKPFDAATRSAVESAEDRTVIEKSLEELEVYRREPNEGPFARPGWLPELFAWTDQQVDSLSLCLTGAFTQLNASPGFSLMRLETNESAVWFKATGEPNRRELQITACIARLFPGCVPELLGVHAAWNGWLTPDVPGRTLDRHTEFASWFKAAGDLARLQILSAGKEAELLESGCRDLRLPQLSEEIDRWIDRLRGLMAAQEKQVPARLTDRELTFLGDSLKQACSRLSEFGLPDTLGHLDFNPGNIVVSPARCVFLDWAEACVANPLVTFEYLREHFRRNCTNDQAAIENLIDAYVRPWQPLVSMNHLKEAALFSPLVAVFAFAAGARASWGTNSSGSYFRSLGRRMFREAGQIMERSERCLA